MLKNLLSLAFFFMIFVSNLNWVQAEIYVQPVVGAAVGDYQDTSYYEARLGAVFSFEDQFLRFETTAFQRFIDEGDDFKGLDLGLNVQRWFQLSQKFLVGTRLGPGYRWASNKLDALFLDFSLSAKHLDFVTARLGYKVLFHELKEDDSPNENLVYLSVEF